MPNAITKVFKAMNSTSNGDMYKKAPGRKCLTLGIHICLTGVSSARSEFVSVNCTMFWYNTFDSFQTFTFDNITPVLVQFFVTRYTNFVTDLPVAICAIL